MSQKAASRAWDTPGLTPVAKLVYLRVAAAGTIVDSEKEETAILFHHTLLSWCGCSHTQLIEAFHELKRREDISGWRFVDVKDRGGSGQTYTAVAVFLPAPDTYYEGDFEDTETQPTTDDIVPAGADITKIDPRRARIYAKTGGVCFYCQESSAAHLDHMHPSSRGGSDADENMIGACDTCNIQKKDRTVEEYRAYLAYKKRAASVAEIRFFGEGGEAA